jgi:hypothetical protein
MPARSEVDGAEALRETVGALGLAIEALEPGSASADLVLINPAGGRVVIEVKRLSLASADGLDRRIKQWSRQTSLEATIGVLVADRVTREAREMLRAAGWGWLDLRGHLHIAGPGLFIDTDVPAMREAPGRSAPLAGRVGVEVAALLLLDPDEPAAVRQIAGLLSRAPSSVSQVLSSMQAAVLLDEERRPTVPELFWELAARWRPSHADVQAVPSPNRGAVNDALRLGFENVEATTGWVLTDTMAAAAYGAPVGVRSDHPLDFYVPDKATLRRAVHLLGAARDRDSRAATVRVAPVPMICSRRVDATGWAEQVWPLAQPLFVALDLAQDPGRGREVLDGWTPGDRGRRVW